MATKPFASSADLGVKEQTLEVLADGVYALTAAGDPNVGAIEGEDFLVCFEALATPVAARRWLSQAARAHRQAGPVPGAQPLPRRPRARGQRVRRRGDRRLRADQGPDRRARAAGLGERVRPDAAAVRGARVHPGADLADHDLPRPAHHRPRRRPRRPRARVPRPRAHRGRHRRLAAEARDRLRRRPGGVAGGALHRRRVPLRLGRRHAGPRQGARARGSSSAAAGRSRGGARRSTPPSSRPATSCSPCSAPSATRTAPAAR